MNFSPWRYTHILTGDGGRQLAKGFMQEQSNGTVFVAGGFDTQDASVIPYEFTEPRRYIGADIINAGYSFVAALQNLPFGPEYFSELYGAALRQSFPKPYFLYAHSLSAMMALYAPDLRYQMVVAAHPAAGPFRLKFKPRLVCRRGTSHLYAHYAQPRIFSRNAKEYLTAFNPDTQEQMLITMGIYQTMPQPEAYPRNYHFVYQEDDDTVELRPDHKIPADQLHTWASLGIPGKGHNPILNGHVSPLAVILAIRNSSDSSTSRL